MILCGRILCVTIILSLHILVQQTKAFPTDYQSDSVGPNHIRLALIPNGMVVSWQTFGRGPTGSNPSPQLAVSYGTSANNLNQISTDGYSTVYDSRDTTCTSYFHNVKLVNLSPLTKYYYQIQKSIYANASDIYAFRTAPEVGDQTHPINMTLVADFGVEFLFSDGNPTRTRKALQQMIPTTDVFSSFG